MTARLARLTHPRTGLPLAPVGYRRNGAPIWPVLGAAEDDDSAAGSSGDGDDEGQDDESGDAPDDGADNLGDAGKQALDRMKAQLKAERAKRRAAELERDEAKRPPEGEQPDPEALKAEGRKAALAEANTRIVRAEVKAAAGGKLTDPSDAVRFIDLAQFEIDDDGNVDQDEIAGAIADLLKNKPYLAVQDGKRFKGDGDGGTRKETERSIDDQIAEAEKAGDFARSISLKRQKAYASNP